MAWVCIDIRDSALFDDNAAQCTLANMWPGMDSDGFSSILTAAPAISISQLFNYDTLRVSYAQQTIDNKFSDILSDNPARINGADVLAISFSKDTLPGGYIYTIKEIPDVVCATILTPATALQNSGTVKISEHITAYNSNDLNIDYWEWFSKNVLPLDEIRNRHFFLWDWRWPPLNTGSLNAGTIRTSFPMDVFNQYQAEHPNNRICVIIDNLTEPPGYDYNFKEISQSLISQGILPKDILLWGSIDDTTDPLPLITIVNTKYCYMYGHDNMRLDYKSLENTTHHFIMLARHPRPLRLMMADRILSRGLLQYGYVSCGCNTLSYDYDTTPFLSDSNRHQFPLVLDDKIENKNPKMYQLTDSRILNAAINVICETSQDPDLCRSSPWELPFATEKSTKAFVLHQFPLIVGVVGMVDCLRRDGFDMFDDLIDHSYDNEPDPAVRITMVTAQLERLLQIRDIAAFRKLHWDRLKYNHDRVKHIINSYETRCRSLIVSWLSAT